MIFLLESTQECFIVVSCLLHCEGLFPCQGSANIWKDKFILEKLTSQVIKLEAFFFVLISGYHESSISDSNELSQTLCCTSVPAVELHPSATWPSCSKLPINFPAKCCLSGIENAVKISRDWHFWTPGWETPGEIRQRNNRVTSSMYHKPSAFGR